MITGQDLVKEQIMLQVEINYTANKKILILMVIQLNVELMLSIPKHLFLLQEK